MTTAYNPETDHASLVKAIKKGRVQALEGI